MSSIDDDIEEGQSLNKDEVFKKICSKLAEKNKEALQQLHEIQDLELKVQQHKDRYRQLTEEEMPSLMDELGVSSVTLSTGERIVIDSSLHCGIKKENEQQAHAWLNEHNHGDLIKTELKIKFGRSESNMVGEIQQKVEQLGLKYDQKAAVHPMTLKAFVNEQMRTGNPPPQDLFSIFIKRVVNVKGN